jgi:hypothetical protein
MGVFGGYPQGERDDTVREWPVGPQAAVRSPLGVRHRPAKPMMPHPFGHATVALAGDSRTAAWTRLPNLRWELMDFIYGSYTVFSKIEARGPTMRAAFGGYLLDLNVRFTPNNPLRGAIVVEDLQVMVSLGEPRRQLGIAFPLLARGNTGTIAIRNMANGRQFDFDLEFRLHLSKLALEEVDACRNGNDATFDLAVHGNIVGYGADGEEPMIKQPTDLWSEHILLNAGPHRVYRPYPGHRSLVLHVPQSEWIKQLEAAGYQRSILLEIPFSDHTTVGEGGKHLRDAQDAFFQGRYADAVSRCRDALDSVIPVYHIGQRQLFKVAAEEIARRQMTAEDAFSLAWASIRQITNATHHRNRIHVAFTRPMAEFVLGATALALNLAGKEKDIFTRLPEARESRSD